MRKKRKKGRNNIKKEKKKKTYELKHFKCNTPSRGGIEPICLPHYNHRQLL